MKNLIFLIIYFLTSTMVISQDVIVTTDNNFLNVEIVSIDDLLTFYKEKEDGEVMTLSNENIKAIQWNSKKSEHKEAQVKKAQIKSDMLVNNFTLLESNNNASETAFVLSGLFAVVTLIQLKAAVDQLCIFCPEEEQFNGLRVWVPLTGAVVSCIVAIAKRKKSKFSIKENETFPALHTYELINRDLKKQNNTSYLDASQSGVGLQWNF